MTFKDDFASVIGTSTEHHYRKEKTQLTLQIAFDKIRNKNISFNVSRYNLRFKNTYEL